MQQSVIDQADSELPGDNTAFDAGLQPLIAPALDQLSRGLAELPELAPVEREAVIIGTAAALTEAVRRKVSRLLVLELNAARVSGTLRGSTGAERWAEFLDRIGRTEFWLELADRYPTLPARLATLITNRSNAAYELARRFGNSRSQLGPLLGDADGTLTDVAFGLGDSHRSGRSVALLEVGSTTVVYKPRSLAIDRAFDAFLGELFQLPAAERIRVPRVVNCATYGWTEFVGHRYCENSDELSTFYRRIGHWLAVSALFGTSDLHAENMIAAGPTPVLVDCETVFTPFRGVKPFGAGDATDRAVTLLTGTVLTSGLLPNRGVALGWRGVDMSAAGSLPGQQPTMRAHQIVGAGTDEVRFAMGVVPRLPSTSLPAPEPELARYWPEVLAGYDEVTERLVDLDRTGWLDRAFAGFADVDVRAVLRSTEAYSELGRMLWHPVSLHDEPAAVQRATDVLRRHAAEHPIAPSTDEVIAAEVTSLLIGDIPYFQTTPASGWARGPGDATGWGEPHDVLVETLRRWRDSDRPVERELIRASVACAYLNDGYLPADERLPVEPTPDRLTERRRRLTARLVEELVRTALHGADGTATWIGPVLNPTGWSVQPLSPDLYSGLPGVALLLAGYRREVDAGRALPVGGTAELLDAVLASMRAADEHGVRRRDTAERSRPEEPGLYLGLGSQLWCWSALADLGAVSRDEADQRARSLAERLPESLTATDESELLKGRAGAIVALLRLADRTADARWLDLAVDTGNRLVELALTIDGRSRWASPLWPAGIGGLAHGATGIGWALARLGVAADRPDFVGEADRAFAFEESLWSPAEHAWQDLRYESVFGAAWCHGAAGIGLVAADLVRRGGTAGIGTTDHADVLRRAAEVCWQRGLGYNHTLCHGDLGVWELLALATELGAAPAGLDLPELAIRIVSSLEQHGVVAGLVRTAFVPGLMPGSGGIAYQLLRMDAACDLPSILLAS